MDISKRRILAVAALGVAEASSARSAAPAPGESVSFQVWSAINAATQGYADCLDRFDMEALGALFAPDCVYDYSPGLIMNGREAVVAGARKSLAGVARSSHSVGPPVVTAASGRGAYASVVYFTAYHEQKDGGRHTVWGRYVDRFEPGDGGRLLIAHRQTLSHAAEGTTAPRYWLPRSPS